MVGPYLVFLLLLGTERAVELGISRRHAAWAFANGGIEFGRGHFRYMALLHVAFLVGSGLEVVLLERPFIPLLGFSILVLVLAAEALRYWCIRTLGRHWNVRVIVLPEMTAVTRGPYRFLRHPNYLAVIVEGFAIPLVHTAWLTALTFSLLNAWMLVVRIRCEESALSRYARYDERLGDRRRFVPMAPHTE